MTLFETLKRKYKRYTVDKLQRSFENACKKGDLPIVQYLLTLSKLKDHTHIKEICNQGLSHACYYGHLEIVQYLLTTTNLTINADSHANNYFSKLYLPYINACQNQHISIVIYLLSFNGHPCIPFEKMNFNIDWAMEKRYDDLIVAMMKNLQHNSPLEYLEYLSKIEKYDKSVYEVLKDSGEGVEFNSFVPDLLF